MDNNNLIRYVDIPHFPRYLYIQNELLSTFIVNSNIYRGVLDSTIL